MNPTPAVVQVVEGVKADFDKRHRKDKSRATKAWANLLRKRPALEQDTTYGQAIRRDLWPKRFSNYPNLFRLELVQGFRVVYTVLFDRDLDAHVVSIEWVGDHREYDRLFGYSTS